jgi:hypothetical protein
MKKKQSPIDWSGNDHLDAALKVENYTCYLRHWLPHTGYPTLATHTADTGYPTLATPNLLPI